MVGTVLIRRSFQACSVPWLSARFWNGEPHVGLLMPWHRGMAICVLLVVVMAQCVVASPPQSKPQSPPEDSQVLHGKVTAIVDGDTLHVKTLHAVYIVDLVGIDAPEKGQLFGDMAAQVLYLRAFHREVDVLALPASLSNPIVRAIVPRPTPEAFRARPTPGADLRQRVLGIVYCDGCVNSDLVRQGIAWHDPRAGPSPTLARSQESAQRERRGLWQSDEQAIPPWQWRAEREPRDSSPGTPEDQGPQVPDLSRYYEAKTPPAVVEAAVQMQPAASHSPTSVMPNRPALGGYWLTESSGIRHNSKCRYFQTSKGRACTAAEGRPCQKCGG